MKDITILIATGLHRPTVFHEKIAILGKEIASTYNIVDHNAEDNDNLVNIGKSLPDGTSVKVNSVYVHADLKIIVGLLEPHFMAGFSGGRKSICPGIVSKEVINYFHSPATLEDIHSSAGILNKNPCHHISSEVARAVGVDFSINVTIDKGGNITGVFIGDLGHVFQTGVEKVKRTMGVEIDHLSDVVITSAGGYPLDINFYQSVKSMVNAALLAKRNGTIIVVGSCSEGIGSKEYEEIMKGYDGDYKKFLEDIKSSGVRKDQWEYEMQCRVLKKVGIEGIIYCTTGIEFAELEHLSVTPANKFSNSPNVEIMLQETINKVLANYHNPMITIIPEGPYILPLFNSPCRTW